VLTIILIIIIICLLINKNNLEKEMRLLRKEIKKLKNNNEKENIIKTEEKVLNTNNIEAKNSISNVNTERIKIDNKKVEKAQQVKQKEKNSLVLIAGAILIVLAAIVFLTSTWDIVSNTVKTVTLLLLIGVFLGASYIAKNVLKIKQTAKTFFYISMAYVPIALVSISFFKLFGEYLSIFGEGRFIYFSLSSVLLSVLYFISSEKISSKLLTISSLIMQILTIIFTTLIFTDNIKIIIEFCLIYTMILSYMYYKNKLNKFKIKLSPFIKTNIICISIIQLSITLVEILINQCQLINFINTFLLMIIYYIIYFYEKNIRYAFWFLIGIIGTIFTIINLKVFNFSFSIKYLFILVGITIEYLYFILNKKYKNFEGPIKILGSILGLILYIIALYCESIKYELIIPSFLIVFITMLLCIVTYLNSKDRKKGLLQVITLLILLLAVNIISFFKLEIYYLLVVSLIMFMISGIDKKKLNNIKEYFESYGNAMVIFSSTYLLISDFTNIIKISPIFIAISISYVYMFFKKEKELYKIIGYVFLNLSLLSIFKNIKAEQLIRYIPAITTITILVAENYISKLNTLNGYIFNIISATIAFIGINLEITNISFLVNIFMALLFVKYIYDNKINENVNVIPITSLIPNIYGTIFSKEISLVISIISILLITLISANKKKFNIYTISSIVFLIFQCAEFELNKYVNIIVILVWAIWHTLNYNEKQKDIFKVISYLTGLVLYNNIIKDIKLDDVTTISLLGYISFSIILIRTIIIKYIKNGYKTIEYIVYSILFLYAINSYNNEIDGIIFVSLLVVLVIISYNKKIGPLFLTSIISIIINSFLLTIEFWFSIPWWVYMLVVGIILIMFATRNELNQNKKKIGEGMKKIKEYMDI